MYIPKNQSEITFDDFVVGGVTKYTQHSRQLLSGHMLHRINISAAILASMQNVTEHSTHGTTGLMLRYFRISTLKLEARRIHCRSAATF